ncbi:MAG: hypothetical protein M3O15_07205 [Acidobacteriota bacterium]|nr:hypothetical protein [Acidobacteriota bacterium]
MSRFLGIPLVASWIALATLPGVAAAQGGVTPGAIAAQGVSNLVISGNEVTAALDLPGIHADLSLTFEQAVGLTPRNLGLSAQLVDPRDPGLLSRLPPGGSLPAAFPVLVLVQPPESGGLSFSGIETLSIHAYDLEFTAGCPLRLLTASRGEPFHDITVNMGQGSYRVRGTSGTFSEFLIAGDTRPLATVIGQKFDTLDRLLAEHGETLSASLRSDLQSRLHAARASYAAGEGVEAARGVGAFADTVRRHSGSEIPDVWRAGGDLVNLAGLLRAAAGTLQLSLSLMPSTP